MSDFWDTVEKCDHDNLTDHFDTFTCSGAYYCDGQEVHCRDCGVFITTCGCGFNNGESGWSRKREIKYTQVAFP